MRTPDVAAEVLASLANPVELRLLLAGPPGVGKSKLAASLATCCEASVIDLDAVAKEPGMVNPCSKANFTFAGCLLPRIRGASSFIIDAGGQTLFPGFLDADDRRQRCEELAAFARGHLIAIVLLTASSDELKRRFLACGNRTPEQFESAWLDWTAERPCWDEVDHLAIDTT